MKKILIRVYCGIIIEDKCGKQLHPLNDVKEAQKIIMAKKSVDCYSNSPDFVSTIKYLGEKENVQTEFFLNGLSFGNNIDPIFGDFNKAMDYMADMNLL